MWVYVNLMRILKLLFNLRCNAVAHVLYSQSNQYWLFLINQLVTACSGAVKVRQLKYQTEKKNSSGSQTVVFVINFISKAKML